MIKFNHLWYLLHICCDFAIIVNPFFRAVIRVVELLFYKIREWLLKSLASWFVLLPFLKKNAQIMSFMIFVVFQLKGLPLNLICLWPDFLLYLFVYS